MRCGECLYWVAKVMRDDRAPCVVEGPKLIASTDPLTAQRGTWPRTHCDEWCGLFKPLPPATGVQVLSVEVVD